MFICYREPCLSVEVHFSDLFPFVRNGPAIISDLSSLTVLNHSGIVFLRRCYVLQFHPAVPVPSAHEKAEFCFDVPY